MNGSATPTLQEEIERLRAGLGRLQGRDVNFANSLIAQYDVTTAGIKVRGAKRLSAKQGAWVSRLANRAEGGDQAPTEDLGSFSGVFDLMARAREHLKYPKVRLSAVGGQPVAISVAGERSKYAGQIQVTDGGSYGSNEWFGRIDTDGTWTQSRRADNEQLAAVGALLRRLGDDPAGVASEHGRLTGCCCFCNRGLDDARSTEVGYGKVCASHYNLPWGNRRQVVSRARTRNAA